MNSKQIGAEALRSIPAIIRMSNDDINRLTGDELKHAVQGLIRKVWTMQKESVKQKRTIEAKSVIIEHQQSTQHRMIAEVVEQLKGVRS